MSTSAAISQLSNLVYDLESWLTRLDGLPSQFASPELKDLDMIAAKLARATEHVKVISGQQLPPYPPDTWNACEESRKQAKSAVECLLRERKFKPRQIALFARNIKAIFQGTQPKVLDSGVVRNRKIATNVRGERLRNLSANDIVAWAAAFKPTFWAEDRMGEGVFYCLAATINFKGITWPPVVMELLENLRRDELRDFPAYDEFMNGAFRSHLCYQIDYQTDSQAELATPPLPTRPVHPAPQDHHEQTLMVESNPSRRQFFIKIRDKAAITKL